ncbi:DMT family transporter [Solirhodobacter olei]|uniref:DMT family transporter n=1 Tax=Solirhodobacter olei TaxID=2493082 RepID=UPI000FD9B4DD|nr:DMT family transporter [Solirhodobacter olei]
MTEQNNRLGILLMVATTMVFAGQDGISRYLASHYNVFMVVMIRFWFFAAFVIVASMRRPGGIRRAAATKQPAVQIFRGVLLVLEVCVMIYSFTAIGLVQSHAVFSCYPLLIAALSGPVLGEKVGWRRWTAIGIGFCGVLIILAPGVEVFSPLALIPLVSALMFSLYGLLTRYVARQDPASVSFFWTGVAGAAAMTLVGIWFWEPMTTEGWIWMAVLCCTAVTGHYLMIRAYEVAEVAAIQPFAFLQLIFASAIGVSVFGDAVALNTVIGAVVVVSAGLFTLWRARVKHEPAVVVTDPSAQP